MTHGMDTSFLVVLEMREHTDHFPARNALARKLAAGDKLVIAPQVLTEFMHVVSDSRRFTQPLDMATTCKLAQQWWTSKDVVQVFSKQQCNATVLFLAQAVLFRSQTTPRYTPGCDLPPSGHYFNPHNQSD